MKKIVSILLLILAVKSYGQNEQPKLNNSMIPPSPDAASLGKYGVFPVTLYTGSANISIPITEVKTNKLSLPISLSYNYNGYKVGDEASSIGLGWALQAGGVITRMPKSRTDDQQIPALDYKWYDIPYLTDFMESPEYLDLIKVNRVDMEPDIFTFSFSGYSGKFILVGQRAFLFPKQDLVITENGGGFFIHTPDGAIYDFSTAEITKPANGGEPNPGKLDDYKSSWYLTSIRSEHSNETINFTYTDWIHRLPHGAVSDNLTKTVSSTNAGDGCYNIPCFTYNTTQSVASRVSAKQIATISSSNMLVKFIKNTVARNDLIWGNIYPGYSIKTIEIYNKPNNELIKKIDLNQGYFGPSNDNNATFKHLKLNSVQTTGYKYKKVNGQTVTETLQEPPHVFAYNNEEAEFYKVGRGIDKWGYYNGANTNQTLFNSEIPENFPTIPTGDREVHVEYMKSGILQKITYPTGGFSTFEYENNIVRLPQYGDNIPVTQLANKTTINPSSTLPSNPAPSTSSNGFFTITTQQNINVTYGRNLFNAEQSPTVGAESVFKISMIPLGYQWDDPNLPTPIEVYVSQAMGFQQVLNWQLTTPPISLQPGNYKYTVTCKWDWQNAYVNFNYTVMEPYMGHPGPGLRIKKINSFDNINNVSPKLLKEYSYGNGAKLLNQPSFYTSSSYELFAACYSKVITTYNSEYSSSLYTLYNEQFYYPKVTEVNVSAAENGKTVYEYYGSNDISAVNLIAQTDYKANGEKVREVTNEYGDPFSGTKTIHFWGLNKYNLTKKIVNEGCGNQYLADIVYPNNGLYVDVINRTELYSAQQYTLWSEPRLQLSKLEKVYDNSQLNPNTSATTYLYESEKHLNPTKIVVNNSKGETVTTQMKYPLDYPILSCESLNTIDFNFKTTTRPTHSQNYQAARAARYNGAFAFIYPPTNNMPTYEENPGNNPLKTYLQTLPCESNYKSNYGSALSAISASGINAYACYNPTGQFGANGALINMQRFNNQTPIEKIVSITKGSSTYLQAATKTDYSLFSNNGNFWTQPKTIYTTEVQPNTVLLSNFNSSYYKPKIDFKFNNTSIIEQSKTNDVKMAYVWDYNTNLAIAEVANAATEDIAATSFESNGQGGFSFSGTPSDDGTDVVTGTKYYNIALGAISKSGLTASKTYTVSYWGVGPKSVTGSTTLITGRTINGYTYYEHQVNNVNNVTISGGGNIDELRVYPAGALMTTYTYQPLVGVTTKCDANNRISYYSYDALARLELIRDQDNNILKKLCYNYAGQPENCMNCVSFEPVWQNTANTRCMVNSYGVNTGVEEIEQQNINSCVVVPNQWISNGTNTTNCPIPPYVNLTSTNTYGTTGYVAKYTPIPFLGTPGDGTPYYFNVPATTGLQALGSVPEGIYTVEIYRTSSPPYASFRGGCWKPLVTGTSAMFYNVNVTTCNSISITLEQ